MNQNKSSRSFPFQAVRSDVNFPKQEEEILKFWNEKKIFEKSLQGVNKKESKIHSEKEKALPIYNFYDGPPFATGLPHYGHIMAGILKDIIPRFWTMNGYQVPRRFGWDCHGLPVEYEINKALHLESRKDIINYGVGEYNKACKSIVQRYAEEWKKTIQRVGRWVDMEKAYFTMDLSFMQSVWWVFQELWNKGLIYEGHKVVPYSTGISTVLSNFEANQNYKLVQDPAITVSFPVIGEIHTYFLAWTTTPWTLPSNLALAVGNDISYVKVKEKSSGKTFILAETLLKNTFKSPETELESQIIVLGRELVGLKYEPIFDYFKSKKSEGAFRVIHSDHVTTESGTGIVHIAPAFGEDDYYACLREKISLVNPVDDDGMFTSEVPDYQGKRVKEADKDIIADLKKKGFLFKHETITHNYPMCWRTDTPLIYRAVSSWFVAVEKIKEQIISSNQNTKWVPDHIRDGRFGNWLESARDWAISRNRFWGTPLPIWRNVEGEVICVGSAQELEKLSGQKVDDLHTDRISSITIPSPTGKSPLKRIDEVLDCWFESGCMPYAQRGYPYENKEEFSKYFPAQFIAEGLDQTRGWFYTLTIIGTALFNRSPFENVIVNGLILAEDGKKMSKRLKNYPDPMEILSLHGADALRLYLIQSPVVKAQELRFSEAGVKEMVRSILLRWWNSYSFFVNYANIDQFKPQGDSEKSDNLLDQWLLSRMQTLIVNTQKEMREYRLFGVVPALLQFIEDLTNTYIRFNRRHFWKDGMPNDKRMAYETLYETLLTLSRVMAPFAPFLSEATYQNLSQVLPDSRESVHLESYPEARLDLIRPELEEAVKVMETLVLLGRNYREKISVKAKIPLLNMKIIHRDQNVLNHLKKFQPYFQDELNIRHIEYCANEDDFISITAKANFTILGKRLGPKMKSVAAGIGKLSLNELLQLEAGKTIQVEGESISLSEVEIRRSPKGENPSLSTHTLVSIEIDPTVTSEQEQEGLAREVVRKIQAARKSADFILDDRIRVELNASQDLKEAIESHLTMIKKETLCQEFEWAENPHGFFNETVEIDHHQLSLAVTALARK